MIEQELKIETLKIDLKQLLISRFINQTPRRSRIPSGLRESYRDQFLGSHPILLQVWLVLTSNLEEKKQSEFILKLFMYRDIDPAQWLQPWLYEETLQEETSEQADNQELNRFVDYVVEKPLLGHVKEQRHVKWLLRAVTSDENQIVKRLNTLWTNMDIIQTVAVAKNLWMPLLQYTLNWRSTKKKQWPMVAKAESKGQKLLEQLQNQIDELGAKAAFEDFEAFVSILAERYRGIGINQKRKSKKGPQMDDRLRILRRVNFWSNYRDQSSEVRFYITPEDYEAYHQSSLQELLLGDESIRACTDLPNKAPLMAINLGQLVVISALTDPKQATYFVPINSQLTPHTLFSVEGPVSYSHLTPHFKQEAPYYHRYLWQVLFTLILEGGGVAPDQKDQPFILGGEKFGEYVVGGGLKFNNKELSRQESQLTDLLRAKPSLLKHLSAVFGEELRLPELK